MSKVLVKFKQGNKILGYVTFCKFTKYYGIAQMVIGQTKTHWKLGYWVGNIPGGDGYGIYIRPIWNVKKDRVVFSSY